MRRPREDLAGSTPQVGGDCHLPPVASGAETSEWLSAVVRPAVLSEALTIILLYKKHITQSNTFMLQLKFTGFHFIRTLSPTHKSLSGQRGFVCLSDFIWDKWFQASWLEGTVGEWEMCTIVSQDLSSRLDCVANQLNQDPVPHFLGL